MIAPAGPHSIVLLTALGPTTETTSAIEPLDGIVVGPSAAGTPNGTVTVTIDGTTEPESVEVTDFGLDLNSLVLAAALTAVLAARRATA